jgi:putative transposase
LTPVNLHARSAQRHRGAFMEDLKTFIQTTRDSRELKRALAVQNTLEGQPWQAVAQELGVCRAFIGKWRKQYERYGVAGLRLGYAPWQGYLEPAQQQAIVTWLQEQKHWDIRRLAQEVERRYGVVYKSKQSYYALFHRAKLSWKKTQKRNPSADPAQVEAKREEIQKKPQS